ncbi:MAG: ATP-binding protein [Planctomycetaceae bacterium]
MTTALVLENGTGSDSVLEQVRCREDWTTEWVSERDEALERLAAGRFEVLLVDSEMVRDGKDWLTSVRETYPNLPVVLVTSNASHEASVKALLLGAATFVPRDRLARDLVGIVERIMALACSNGAPTAGHVLSATSHRYVMGNDRSVVASVLRHTQMELERFGICERPDRLRVAVALEEALINAIVHGNLEVSSQLRDRGDDSFERVVSERATAAPFRDRQARLEATFRTTDATFVVTDDGPGFDPTAVPDPTDPENLIKPYGRGLLLMRTFMNEVRHNAVGNEVTLVKWAAGK